MKAIAEQEHELLAIWAAECAEHVLSIFEQNNPEDDRPKKAIEAIRAWVRGEITITEARKFAFNAHASAREADNTWSKAAARAAGHAAATAHVFSHAKYAASYALKAAINPTQERDWQLQSLPAHLYCFIQLDSKKKKRSKINVSGK